MHKNTTTTSDSPMDETEAVWQAVEYLARQVRVLKAELGLPKP